MKLPELSLSSYRKKTWKYVYQYTFFPNYIQISQMLKLCILTSSIFVAKHSKSKDMQEKMSVMDVKCRYTTLPIVMLNSDLQYSLFCQHPALMKDTSDTSLGACFA